MKKQIVYPILVPNENGKTFIPKGSTYLMDTDHSIHKPVEGYLLSDLELEYLLQDFIVFQRGLKGTDTDIIKRFLSEY